MIELLFGEPWPWWLGGPMLALIALTVWVIERRMFGVSGSFGRVVAWRRAEKREAELLANEDAMRAAMLQATLAEFGDEAENHAHNEPAEATPAESPLPPLPWSVHALFLGAIVVGAALASVVAGTWSARFDLGATHARLVADGWHIWPLLLLGGVLAGFGTRMAGGCTSGHGLGGCSRMQVGSLVATASFFGIAICLSLLLRWAA